MGELRFTVRVRPGATRARVGGAYGEPPALIVAVRERAVDGRANQAVLKAIAAALEVPESALACVAGATARSKIISVASADEAVLAGRLAELLQS